MLEALREEILGSGPEDAGSVLIETLGSVDSSERGVMGEGDVGELRVVGRARGAGGIPRLEGIGVYVVAGVLRDGIGEVPWVSEGKVVRSVGETNRVLVEESGEGDRVGGKGGRSGEDRGQCGIVRHVETILAAELLLE